jgi:hypothetical protein
MSRKQAAEELRWKAQDALSTLTRAEQIRKDTKLMTEVRKYAEEQVKNLAVVTKVPARKKKAG